MTTQRIITYPNTYTIKEYQEFYNKDIIIHEHYDEQGRIIKERTPFLSAEYIYIDDKRITHGQYLIYHRNGNIELDCNYQYGKLHGYSKQYHRNGNLAIYAFYLNGVLNGKNIFYNSDGVITYFEEYKDGKRIENEHDLYRFHKW